MTELKNLADKMKNSLKCHTSRVTAIENRISEIEDEFRNTSIQQKKLEKSLKTNEQKIGKTLEISVRQRTINLWNKFNRNNRTIGVPESQKKTLMKNQQSKKSLLKGPQF